MFSTVVSTCASLVSLAAEWSTITPEPPVEPTSDMYDVPISSWLAMPSATRWISPAARPCRQRIEANHLERIEASHAECNKNLSNTAAGRGQSKERATRKEQSVMMKRHSTNGGQLARRGWQA